MFLSCQFFGFGDYRRDFADVYEAGEVRVYYLFGIPGIL